MENGTHDHTTTFVYDAAGNRPGLPARRTFDEGSHLGHTHWSPTSDVTQVISDTRNWRPTSDLTVISDPRDPEWLSDIGHTQLASYK